MALINKILHPTLKLIDSFKRMRTGHVTGLSFGSDAVTLISKSENSIKLKFVIPITDYSAVDNAKQSNLPEFHFTHNHKKWIIPANVSRIENIRDNVLCGGSNDFSLALDSQAIYDAKIDINRKYFFRYIVPIPNRAWHDDYDRYHYESHGKNIDGLIKITCPTDQIHLFQFEYKKQYYLVIESGEKYELDQFEKVAFNTLLTLGFLSGTLHLNEVFIVAANRKSFNVPVGIYFKTLRKSIKGQYSIFTTNAYSVLMPLSAKMTAKDAKERMLTLIERHWKFRIDRISMEVFSNMVTLFNDHDSIARAALMTLSASWLEHEVQSGVYCIAFETLCSKIYKTHSLIAPRAISECSWNSLKPVFSDVVTNTTCLSEDEIKFIKNKLENLNQPTNASKLRLPFEVLGYNLSQAEIKAINDRNKFLHGHLNIDKGDKEIDKLFYTSLMFHKLCCVLILKLSGFEGYIINNIPLHAPFVNYAIREWGFKRI
ncbi:hypothetical protein [Parabacteroides provencensis]|uniref:hypothetical protein n=1 Tax=Parabacteroides provencensis TaxID=1944636 RepID=UPI000C146681|nr:hypothetical protein [Parabacteroides provencensis]